MKMLLACALLCATGTVAAQDRADIDKTQIIGNRELPKVLYIVPWKKPLPGQLSGRPVQSVLDEALAPVERDVHRRHVNYAGQVQAQLSARADKAGAPLADKSPSTAQVTPAAPGAPR